MTNAEGLGGRREAGCRIFVTRQRRAQTGDVELLGETVVVQVIAVRRVYGWIELDQHIAGLHRLPVLHSN